MNRIIKAMAFVLILTTGMNGCQKETVERNDDNTSATPYENAFVLNEGNWGNNDGSLSLLNISSRSINNQYFEDKNGRGLGDVAQDMDLYGSRLYVTVTFSNSVEAIDRSTGKATHIDMAGHTPRYITHYGGKLYVTCYNPCSVVRIDTATLQIDGICLLGEYHPEGLCALNGKLYVATGNISDDAYNYYYDNKLTVLDIATFAIEKQLEIGYNPQHVVAIDDHQIAVDYLGDFATNGGGCAIVDTRNGSVSQTGITMTRIETSRGNLYGYAIHYDDATYDSQASYYCIDGQTHTATEILSDCHINNPYGIAVNPQSGDIYISTNGNYTAQGDVVAFSPSGKRLWSVEAGMLPSKILCW